MAPLTRLLPGKGLPCALALILLLLLGMTPASAGGEEERLVRWYERIQRELKELEGRIGTLDGKSAPSAATKKEERALARTLLQLTTRMMELEKRVAALEKGVPAVKGGDAKPADPKIADAGPVADAGKDAQGAKDLPPFLKDPKIAEKIPAPPKDSAVDIVTTKSGLKKGVVSMPKGRISGPYGRLACTPSAEVFLVQDAPVFALSLVLVNKVGFRFKEEKYVYIVIDGNTTKSAMRWEGSVVETDEEILYVETLHFGTGLPNFLSLIDAGRVRVLVGACEFVIERLCIAALRDLCSCLHPDRVDRLR
ncbi:MAG: hypothetical protein P1V36_15275 [Planctomycetota bacterium]|nr:hypothetical protein [Planctomycetota bacterium]